MNDLAVDFLGRYFFAIDVRYDQVDDWNGIVLFDLNRAELINFDDGNEMIGRTHDHQDFYFSFGTGLSNG